MSQWDSISELVKSVKSGNTSALDLVNKSLEIIESKKDYQAVIAVVKERALERAKIIDDKLKNDEDPGSLAGIPFIAKDNFLAFGSDTTAASNILKGFKAPFQATVINKLEEAGAILVAKSNLDAFAHGSSTENSDFMITKNPHDPQRVPGGSSGGSAAAVILDMAPFALGTDTGGSIRLPAAFCGAVGYKPTYGLVSRNGVIAMASSTDVIGPITKTVDDTAYVMNVIAGRDSMDSTTIDREPTYAIDDLDLSKIKIGRVKEYFPDDLDPKIKQQTEEAIELLKSKGATIEEVSLPSLPLSLACYYIVVPAEISSNLSRYDGQRYGYSNVDAKTLDESYLWSRSEGFGKEAKRRIMIGTYVLSSGYFDAYYRTAQKLRTKLINEFNKAFETVDYLIGPTAPILPFPIGEVSDPLQMYLTDIMTVAANLTGVPAISVPNGRVDNLPVGLQLIAPQRQDKSLLNIAAKTEELINA